MQYSGKLKVYIEFVRGRKNKQGNEIMSVTDHSMWESRESSTHSSLLVVDEPSNTANAFHFSWLEPQLQYENILSSQYFAARNQADTLSISVFQSGHSTTLKVSASIAYGQHNGWMWFGPKQLFHNKAQNLIFKSYTNYERCYARHYKLQTTKNSLSESFNLAEMECSGLHFVRFPFLQSAPKVICRTTSAISAKRTHTNTALSDSIPSRTS